MTMKKHLTAEAILERIETGDVNTRYRLREEAPVKQMILALEQANSTKARMLLCTILGDVHAKSAGPILIRHLTDPDLNVRIYSAEALGKIGDPKAGPVLLALFNEEQPSSLRSTLAVAWGQSTINQPFPD